MLLAALQDTLRMIADSAHALPDTTVLVVEPNNPGPLSGFLLLVIPIISAIAGSFIAEKMQKVSGWLDSLPAGVKQIGVAAIVYWLNWGAQALGQQLGLTDMSLTAEQASNLTSALLAFLLHGQKRDKERAEGKL